MKRKFEQTEENKCDIITLIPQEISNLVFTFIHKKTKKEEMKRWVLDLRIVSKSWNQKIEFWMKEHAHVILSNENALKIYHRILPKEVTIRCSNDFHPEITQSKNVTDLNLEDGWCDSCVAQFLHVTSLNIIGATYMDNTRLKKFKNLSTLKMVSGKPLIGFEMPNIKSLELQQDDLVLQSTKYFPNLKALKLVKASEDEIHSTLKSSSSIESLALENIYESNDYLDWDELKLDKVRVLKVQDSSCFSFLNNILNIVNLEHLVLKHCEMNEFLNLFVPMSNLKTIEIHCDEKLSMLFINEEEFWKFVHSCKNLVSFILREQYTVEIDYKVDKYPEQKRSETLKEVDKNWKLLISMPNIRFAQWKSNILNYQFIDSSFTNFGFLDS